MPNIARVDAALNESVAQHVGQVAMQTAEALIGFRGGEARTGKLGCEHLAREQRRE